MVFNACNYFIFLVGWRMGGKLDLRVKLEDYNVLQKINFCGSKYSGDLVA